MMTYLISSPAATTCLPPAPIFTLTTAYIYLQVFLLTIAAALRTTAYLPTSTPRPAPKETRFLLPSSVTSPRRSTAYEMRCTPS